jgi:F420-0:gamma-glutamyl ligase-like protein
VKHYRVLAVSTPYWKPKENYIQHVIDAVKGKIKNGDIVTVSEKAISTAMGNVIDESVVKPSRTARFLAEFWMPIIWGYVLGPFCHLKKETIQRFKTYPKTEGAKHKQVALEYAGFLQAFMHGSEGGIDGSNLPFSYVSLTLSNATEIATKIRNNIKTTLRKAVTVMIVDTDRAYSFRNFHFTPRPRPAKGIRSHGGVLAYVAGRFLKLNKSAIPIAMSGDKHLSIKEALHVATIANLARGYGAGRTVWDMAERFNASLTQVTWEDLAKIDHKPIVIVRPLRGKYLR